MVKERQYRIKWELLNVITDNVITDNVIIWLCYQVVLD